MPWYYEVIWASTVAIDKMVAMGGIEPPTPAL